HAARRPEVVHHDADGHAGAAGFAGGPVGDRLAAAEAAMGEQVVQLGRAVADQMREYLALLLAGEIRARRGRGQVELRRVARVLGHGGSGRSTEGKIARRGSFVKSLPADLP